MLELPTPTSILRFVEQRKLNKRRRIIGEGFMELHHMTVHYKGRLMLALMINDPNNGLDFSLRRMYAIVLQAAPIQEWARWN